MSDRANARLELVDCPECAAPAEVVDRFDLPSTDGPVEHATVLCLHRHRFTMAVTAHLRSGHRDEEGFGWNRAA